MKYSESSENEETPVKVRDILEQLVTSFNELHVGIETSLSDSVSQEMLASDPSSYQLTDFSGEGVSGEHYPLSTEEDVEQALQDPVSQTRSVSQFFKSMENLTEISVWMNTTLESCVYAPTFEDLSMESEKIKDILQFLVVSLARANYEYFVVRTSLSEETITQFESLTSNASELVQRGFSRGQALQQCAVNWCELDGLFQRSSKWLQEKQHAAQNQQPCLKEDFDKYVSFFKNLQSDIQDHHPQVMHINKLHLKLKSVVKSCVLDNRIADFNSDYNRLCKIVAMEVERIVKCTQEWHAFEKDLKNLQEWLNKTEQRSNLIHRQILNSEQTTETLFEKLRDILRLQLELESKYDTYQQLVGSLEQATLLHIYDETTGSEMLKLLMNEWCSVAESLENVMTELLEMALNSYRSELLPELQSWVEGMKSSVNGSSLETVTSLADIRSLSSQYKSLMKQLELIQKICSCVLNVPEKDLTSKEETSDSGQLERRMYKAVLQDWHDVSTTLKEKMDLLDLLLQRWTEFDSSAMELIAWLQSQETWLKVITQGTAQLKYPSIQETLQKLQNLKAEADVKKRQCDTIKVMGNQLIDTCRNESVQTHVLETGAFIDTVGSNVNVSLHSALMSLTEIANKWNSYNKALEQANLFLSENEYSLSMCQQRAVSLAHLQAQISNLKCIRKELSEHAECIEKVQSSSKMLRDVSDAGVQLELDTAMEMIQNRWGNAQVSASTLLLKQEQFEAEWNKFCSELESLHSWVAATQQVVASSTFPSDNFSISIADFQHQLFELKDKEDILQALEEKSVNLQSETSLLDPVAVRDINSCISTFKTALVSLKTALCYSFTFEKNIHERMESHRKFVQDAASFISHTEAYVADIPSDASECNLEEILKCLEVMLNDGALHYAILLLEKSSAVSESLGMSSVTSNMASELCQLQQLFTDISQRYLMLVTLYTENVKFSDQCIRLLKFLQYFWSNMTSEVPNDYNLLIKYYIQLSLMDIIILGHQYIAVSIIEKGLKSSETADKNLRWRFIEHLDKFYEQWLSVRQIYDERLALVKRVYDMWMQYQRLSHRLLYDIEASEKKLQLQPEIFYGSSDITAECQNIESILKRKEFVASVAEETTVALEDLSIFLDVPMAGKIRESNVEVQHRAHSIFEQVEARLSELQNFKAMMVQIQETVDSVAKDLEASNDILHVELPCSYSELHRRLQDYKERKKALAVDISKVDLLEGPVQEIEAKLFGTEFTNQIIHLRQVSQIVLYKLNVVISAIAEKLEEWPKFHSACFKFLQWCEDVENRIKKDPPDHLEGVIKYMEDIKSEIESHKEEYEGIISSGDNFCSDGEQSAGNILQSITSVKEGWNRINDLWNSKIEKLRRILNEKSSIEQTIESLKQFVKSTQLELYAPIEYQEFTTEEIDRHLNRMQTIQGRIETEHENAAAMKVALRNLMSLCHSYNNSAEKDALNRACENIYKQLNQIKTLAIEISIDLQKVRIEWDSFLRDLAALEAWLDSQENIITEFNSCSKNKRRVVLLEDLKRFEDVSHGIQMNINLHSSINKQFSKLVRGGHVDSSKNIRNRVQNLNSRWDALHNQVNVIIKILQGILEEWENFHCAKEHLLLFLTEVDVTLTEVKEHLEPDVIQGLNDEFEHHEDELQAFIGLSSHLQKHSHSADSAELEHAVFDVQEYWNQLREKLRGMKSAESLKFVQEASSSETSGEVLDEKDSADFQSPSYVQNEQPVLEYDSQASENELMQLAAPQKLLQMDAPSDSKLVTEGDGQQHESVPKDKILEDQLEQVENLEGSPVLPVHVDSTSQKTSVSSAELQSQGFISSDTVLERDASETPDLDEFSPVEEKIPETHEPDSSEYDTVQDTASCSESLPSITVSKAEKECEAYMKELLSAIRETEERLDTTEAVLRNLTPTVLDEDNPSPNYSRLLAACRSSIDVLRHLSDTLYQRHQGLSQVHDLYTLSRGVISRWEVVEAAGIAKEKRAHKNHQQWQQFLTDLDSIERWLQDASNSQFQWESIGDSITKLDMLTHKHKELLSEMGHQKTAVLSLNLQSHKFISSLRNEPQVDQLQERLKMLNKQWESLCTAASMWQNELQKAVLESQEFHRTVKEMVCWLEEMETKVAHMSAEEDVEDLDVMSIRYNKYLELQQELEKFSLRVATLKQTTTHFLSPGALSSGLPTFLEDSSTLQQTETQLQDVSSRLHSLHTTCSEQVQRLMLLLEKSDEDDELIAAPLGTKAMTTERETVSIIDDDEEVSTTNRCCNYFLRVARASFPIQALLLLLLGAAALLPVSEDELSCVLTNNFARSFEPMLRYPDGPPPV